MQTASILLAIAGDSGNIVPKYGVTPSEVAVLQAIHGEDSVTEIQIGDDIDRKGREDIGRLRETYGAFRDANNTRVVDTMFPGVAARAFESFDELDIEEQFYAAEKRAVPKPASATSDDGKPLEKMSKTELVAEAKRRGIDVDASASKAVVFAALTADAPVTETGDEEDDVQDMDDQNVLN